MSIAKLARPEIATLHPYVTAAQQVDTVRLNANEAPRSPSLPGTMLHRYPRIRPDSIGECLAKIYGVNSKNVLVTRGSSEAIDLLVRTFCRAYTDNIVTTPPTFSMYQVYADMQAAAVIEAPLTADDEYSLDPAKVLSTCTANSKLVFICSPNNPTGNLLSRNDILSVARERAGQSLVVVDEAYIEFSNGNSLVDLIETHENLVVLRTLSKAYGLAGTRCGAVIASEEVIRLLAAMLAPYAFAAPTSECILEALSANAVLTMQLFVDTIAAERERVQDALNTLPFVEKVWPSNSNFLLVRFTDLEPVTTALQDVHVLIRTFANDRLLPNCARVTIGSQADNSVFLQRLAQLAETGS